MMPAPGITCCYGYAAKSGRQAALYTYIFDKLDKFTGCPAAVFKQPK
jgi:hypothetical protein